MFWKHTGKITFDTGLSLNYLENVTYIVLDNFRKIEDNIDTELKKWIYLLSADTPERIIEAASISDEFYEIISDVAQFCCKIDEVMNMFSKALREMDRNTELLMWDEMTNELEQLKNELRDTKAEQENTKVEYENTKAEYENTKVKYENANSELKKKDLELAKLKETIKQLQEKAELSK